MALDLKIMSRKELNKLKDDIEKALRDAEIRERQQALKAAEKAVAEFGFSLDELAGAKTGGGTAGKKNPKYRNPDNPEQTWSGRGRKPQWVHEVLGRGIELSDLKI